MKNIIAKEMNRFKEYINDFPEGKNFGTQFDVEGFNVIVDFDRGYDEDILVVFIDQQEICSFTNKDLDKLIQFASAIIEMEVM